MKKLLPLVALLAFALMAPAGMAEANNSVETFDLSVLQMLGYEAPVWMSLDTAVRPFPVPTGPSWCQNRNNQYCSYSWDFANQCCRGSVIIPNSYCPDICY